MAIAESVGQHCKGKTMEAASCLLLSGLLNCIIMAPVHRTTEFCCIQIQESSCTEALTTTEMVTAWGITS